MWKSLVVLTLWLGGCATKTDLETAKTETATSHQTLLKTVSKLQDRVAALENEVADAKSRLNDLVKEQRAAKEASRVRPVAEALALLLKPNAKGLKEMKTTGDERLWDVDSGLVPDGSMVVLGRMKSDPSAWHIGLSGKFDADAFGVAERVCGKRPTFYKITGGPLAGAIVEDQFQEQFIIASASWAKTNWAKSCVVSEHP